MPLDVIPIVMPTETSLLSVSPAQAVCACPLNERVTIISKAIDLAEFRERERRGYGGRCNLTVSV